MKSNIIRRLPLSPPIPTDDEPYKQLDWLCEIFIRRYKNASTKRNKRRVMQAYKKFLENYNGYDNRLAEDPKYFLSIHCDHFVLHNAEIYWKSSGISSNTITNRIGGLRSMFRFAAEENLTFAKIFIEPARAKPKRETLFRAIYNDSDLNFIWSIIAPTYEYAKRVTDGYKRLGIGVDPRNKDQNKEVILNSLNRKLVKSPWSKWENIVWYFENVLNCQPIIEESLITKNHKVFLNAKKYFGILEINKKLGICSKISVDLLAPLAMKLCWETGLNTETLLNLKRDCFQDSHPLTGHPYIRYYKERSTGEKDLHLNLFNTEITEKTITIKQSNVIKRTIQVILKLTEPLVDRAAEVNKDYLFLYESLSAKLVDSHRKVVQLTPQNFQQWARRIIANAKTANVENVPEIMNLGRFRPTKINQLVREGKDFFEIQAIAGHSQVNTTLNYIDSYDIALYARQEVSKILKQIHKNSEEFENNPKPYATSAKQTHREVIYKGVICDCKNIYNPPESVRKLPTYNNGDACTYYNMCLSCPNIIITKKHLPLLIGYKREIEMALLNNLSSSPNSNHYDKTLAIIEGILLEFSENDLNWAGQIAECGDYYFDPLTHQVVIN